MVTIIHERVQDAIEKGMTLDQIKATAPTAGYNARFDATYGPWTTSQFVEAVYESLRRRN